MNSSTRSDRYRRLVSILLFIIKLLLAGGKTRVKNVLAAQIQKNNEFDMRRWRIDYSIRLIRWVLSVSCFFS